MDDSNTPSGFPELPQGFHTTTANVGIKDDSLDFALVGSDESCVLSAVFTQSTFPGPSVEISREAATDGTARGVVVVSKNANVATGDAGLADARELQAEAARVLSCDPNEVIVASTGVIGVRYPMDRLRRFLKSMAPPNHTGTEDLSMAMMTTDTAPKVASASAPSTTGGTARIVGVAKGVGMIEPNMATMLSFVFTDAGVSGDVLDSVFRRVVDRSFNSLSIDTDTSTSDTAAVFANGLAGPVSEEDLEDALEEVCLDLTKQMARDGEGAEKLIEVNVGGARDDETARSIAKSVVNSPLVKTAVHGRDPNWGRIVMAVGKVPGTGVDPGLMKVSFGDLEVYPNATPDLAALKAHLEELAVTINIELGIGNGSWTVYGCDLTDGYVRINADYTT